MGQLCVSRAAQGSLPTPPDDGDAAQRQRNIDSVAHGPGHALVDEPEVRFDH